MAGTLPKFDCRTAFGETLPPCVLHNGF